MQYNGADDWLLWLCMMEEGCKCSLNEDVLYEHASSGSNTSDGVVSMAQSEYEVLWIVQKKKLFQEDDLQLLMEERAAGEMERIPGKRIGNSS